MAHALVTGGAGFIGSHLVERLCAEGHTVRVLDNFITGARRNLAACDGRVDVIEGDIRNDALVHRAVDGVDWVFHLAAAVSVPESVANPPFTLDVNVRGAAVMAYAAAAAGVQRFLFASSCAVYGDTGAAAVAEDAAPQPLSPYGVSKLMGECLLGALRRAGELPALSCRFFNVYGPRQPADSPYSGVIAQFLDRALRGMPLTIYGDGDQTRDFISVHDVTQLLVHAAERNGDTWPDVINVGTGRATTVTELAACVAACAGTAPPVEHRAERQGDLRYSCADISLLQSALDWTATTGLEDGLGALWQVTNAQSLTP